MTLWVMNTIGLLAVTVGSLIVFLHLHRTARIASAMQAHPECAPLVQDRRTLMISMGLMAAWFVIQYVAILFTN